MDTSSSTAMQIDMAKARSAGLDRTMELVSGMDECPSCGAVGVDIEAKAPKG